MLGSVSNSANWTKAGLGTDIALLHRKKQPLTERKADW